MNFILLGQSTTNLYIEQHLILEWFDENYPECDFHEALGITKPQFDYLSKELKNEISYMKENTAPLENKQEKQCGTGTHLENGVCVLDKQETAQEKQEKDGFTKFLDMIMSWFS